MQTDEDFNIKFVQIVENHRCLFDKKVAEYRNKDFQEKSWLEISKEARESVAHCKERWRNLRACLSRYIKQQQTSEPQHKPYYLFEHMQYLLPFLKSTKNTNIQTTTNSISERISTSSSNLTNSPATLPHFNFENQIPATRNQIKSSIKESNSQESVEFNPLHVKNANDLTKKIEFTQKYDSDTDSASNFPDADVQIETNSQTMVFIPQNSQNSCDNKPTIVNEHFLGPKSIPFNNPNNNFQYHNSHQSDGSVPPHQNIPSFYSDNSDMDFFKSILSDIEGMNARQKRKFKIGVLHLIDEIYEDKQPRKRHCSSQCGSTTNNNCLDQSNCFWRR